MINDNFDVDPSDAPDEESKTVHSASSPSDEQKNEIAGWVNDGMGLSDIQKRIHDEFGVVMTYMDVRFLVDDLNLDLVDTEENTPDDENKKDGDLTTDDTPSASPEDALNENGGVNVELDTVTPPGAMASGSVTFSDGQHKKWTLDQFGRLGLSGGDESYKPSDDDVIEFQKQLDGALRGKGF